MSSYFKKNFGIISIFILISLTCLFFSCSKEGMFIDEIYSLGLSNSYYMPFIKDFNSGNILDTVITQQELIDYISVGPDDAFSYDSVYFNQVQDVHPPLYYWLLHTACSVSAVFAVWQSQLVSAMILDYLFYIAALFVLYILVKKLFNSSYLATAAVALYGLSGIGLSTMLMIRMYVLLTLFTLLLSHSVLCILRRGRFSDYVLLFFSILGGFLTQYYFIFYAFSLCGTFVIFSICKKNVKKALIFSITALSAVGVFALIFPAYFDHLSADKLVSGGNALENVMSLSQYSSRIISYAANYAYWMKAILLIIALLFIACAVFGKKIMAVAPESKPLSEYALLLLPAVLAFLVIAICSPIIAVRYVYNIAPIFIIFVVLLIYLFLTAFPEKILARLKPILLVLIVAVSLFSLYMQNPDYLYPEQQEQLLLLENYSDSPCLYINNNYNAPITQDLFKLLTFEDFFVTSDTASNKMLEYIGDADSVVVFIDTDSFWSSGFDPKQVVGELGNNTGLTHITELYSYKLSTVYLMEDIDQ